MQGKYRDCHAKINILTSKFVCNAYCADSCSCCSCTTPWHSSRNHHICFLGPKPGSFRVDQSDILLLFRSLDHVWLALPEGDFVLQATNMGQGTLSNDNDAMPSIDESAAELLTDQIMRRLVAVVVHSLDC